MTPQTSAMSTACSLKSVDIRSEKLLELGTPTRMGSRRRVSSGSVRSGHTSSTVGGLERGWDAPLRAGAHPQPRDAIWFAPALEARKGLQPAALEGRHQRHGRAANPARNDSGRSPPGAPPVMASPELPHLAGGAVAALLRLPRLAPGQRRGRPDRPARGYSHASTLARCLGGQRRFEAATEATRVAIGVEPWALWADGWRRGGFG